MILVGSRTDDSPRLIHDQKYRFFLLAHRLSITDHLLSRPYLHSHHGDLAVHTNLPFLHKSVCLSPRTDSSVTQIFI